MQPESLISSIEALIKGGKTVITADNSIVVAMMKDALSCGRSATFYVTPAQAQAVIRLYLSPGRIKQIGIEAVSKEERARIESELGIKDMGPFFSNRIKCSCGGVYGAFEFMQQGLREHGRDMVGAITELRNVAVLRINPEQDAICPTCGQIIIEGHDYWMYSDDGKLIYGCCRGEIPSGPILA